VNDLRLNIKLNSRRSQKADLSEGTEHLKIV
jgi:Tfp pilus assembly ATPase PilU